MKTTFMGKTFSISPEEVEKVVQRLSPEPIRKHAIIISNRRFPPKQLFQAILEEKGIKVDRLDFNTMQGTNLLNRLGFPHINTNDKGREGIRALEKLTGIVALGGDALEDSEAYYE